MPKIIVKTEYIRDVRHIFNYLEYAGSKLEAQVAVSVDGKRISLPVDHRIDLNNLEVPVSFVEIQTKDGQQQLSTEQYRALVLERTETANKKIISTHDETGRDIELEFRPAQYIRYIGERPGAEKFENGEALFDLTGAVKIEDAQEIAKQLQGNIWWSQIVSLPRAEATRTGFDHREAWQNLVRAKAPEIAKAYNISLENLVLNCAYHNKELNPHIHLFITSKNKRESFVLGGKEGMTKASKRIKSLFFNEIFKGDVAFLKEQKNEQEQAMNDQLTAALKRISSKGYTPNDALTARLFSFAEKLLEMKGRKVYGYLPPELKLEVNEILRLAVADGQLQPLFASYMQTQRTFTQNYVDNPETIAEKLMEAEQRFFEPGKKDSTEFHNVIVKQANSFSFQSDATQVEPIEQLVEETNLSENFPESDQTAEESFSNVSMGMNEHLEETDTPISGESIDREADAHPDRFIQESSRGKHATTNQAKKERPDWWTDDYYSAKKYLHGSPDKGVEQDFSEARSLFIKEADTGNPLAMMELGRMAEKALGCEVNGEQAYSWYEKALAAFHLAEDKQSWEYTQYRIGKMYAQGLGTEQNYEEAAKWLKLSAAKSYQYAQYTLAGLYYNGNGVEQDYFSAFDLYEKAAEKDFPYADFSLGKMLQSGIGCAQNIDEAGVHFQKAYRGFVRMEATGNDDKLQYRIGWMLLNGVGAEKNPQKAKEYLEKAATVENPFACYLLGKMVLQDDSATPEEVLAAIKNLEVSIKTDNHFAQYLLGVTYLEGEKVEQNIPLALELLTASAEHNNSYAAYRLGKYYLELGDIEKTLFFFAASAKENNPFAQYQLGKLYLEGTVVEQDVEKGIAYLEASAAQENPFAAHLLGKFYLENHNPKSALFYFKQAEKQNHAPSLYWLGKMYFWGIDIPQNKELGLIYLRKAQAMGHPAATALLQNQPQYAAKNTLCSLAGLLHSFTKEQQLFNRQQPEKKTVRNLMGQQRRKKWRNFIEN